VEGETGETGYLVPLEEMQESPFEPVDPDQFSRDLAERIDLMADERLQKKSGWTGRKRKSSAGQRLPLKRKRCTSR